MDTKRLRQKILDLAIHGKLVPQDPNDEPASVLLERIRAEKEALMKAGKIKRDKKDSTIFQAADKSHYENVPNGWELAELYDLYNFIDYRGVTPEKISSGVPLVTARNVKLGYIDYKIDEYISYESYMQRQLRGVSAKGDILFTTEAPLGNVALADLDVFSAGQRLITFQNFSDKTPLCNRLFMYFLLSPYFQDELSERKTGTTVAGIKAEKLKRILLPVPPLAEQSRIADAVKQAFDLIDQIEAQKTDLQAAVSAAKQKILSLAVHGKLVQQDPNDEPASVLLQRIRAEKEALVRAGKIKRDKAEKPAAKSDDNSYYPNLPQGWAKCTLGDAFEITMGQSPSGESVSNEPIGIEFHQGKLAFTDKYLSKSGYYTNKGNKIADANSVLLCVRAPVGIVNITARPICIGRGLSAIKPIAGMQSEFAFYWICALKVSFEEKATGTTFKAITNDVVKNEIIALPPLAEQKRIVEAVEKAFAQLDYIADTLA
jgi:type I restriction enzyme S subunit